MERELILSTLPVTQLKMFIADSVSEAFTRKESEALQPKNEDQLLKIHEVCILLNVSKVTIHSWKRKGLIPFHRISNKIYFKKSEVLEALKKVHTRSIQAGGKS